MGISLSKGDIVKGAVVLGLTGMAILGCQDLRSPAPQLQQPGISQAGLDSLLKGAYIVPVGIRVNLQCLGEVMMQYELSHPDRSLVTRFGDVVAAEAREGGNTVLFYVMVMGKLPNDENKGAYGMLIHNNYAPSEEQVRAGNSPFPIIPDAGISGQFARCRVNGPF